MGSSVLSHSGTELVTLEQLSKLPKPKPQGPRHQPVAHAEFVTTLKDQLLDRGYVTHREQLATDHNGVRLFGALDFVPAGAEKLVAGTDIGMSVGIRHANDRTISVGMITGARVFVCDNMAFSGDMVLLRRKHTTNLDLGVEIKDALDRLFVKYSELDLFINNLKNVDVNDLWARDVIYRAVLEHEVIATSHMPAVHDWYFNPPAGATDVQDRTAWGIYNAFTRVIKELAPYRVQDTTTKLTGFFNEVFSLN